ncbi:MAG: transposase [Patescibacteria group bacterium]|nr:transposase [Patescibacteria group bacterium]
MDIFRDGQDFANLIKRIALTLGKAKETATVPIGCQWAPLRIAPFPKNAFTILCYCLMPNHFHFLIRQNTEIAISDFISKLCSSYGKFFNKKYEHAGGLFQDQFKAVRVENDSQLLWASAYIHNNPKTAGLVQKLEDYAWSSYLDYIGKRQGTLCDKEFILKMIGGAEKYKRFTEGGFEKIKGRKELEHLLLDN